MRTGTAAVDDLFPGKTAAGNESGIHKDISCHGKGFGSVHGIAVGSQKTADKEDADVGRWRRIMKEAMLLVYTVILL